MKQQKAYIPPHVLSAMWQFMLKTSVPRILAEEQKRRAEEKKSEKCVIRRMSVKVLLKTTGHTERGVRINYLCTMPAPATPHKVAHFHQIRLLTTQAHPHKKKSLKCRESTCFKRGPSPPKMDFLIRGVVGVVFRQNS